MPPNASFFVYNKNGTLGSFNSSNNKPDNTFSTTFLKGDQVTLEYFEPKDQIGKGQIQLSGIVYGYRNPFNRLKTFGQSGACNVNAICDDPIWNDEIRSVVMILTAGNTRFCSGALINNVLQDETPYILTANHCGISSNNIFMFNYQSSNCTPSIDGPTNQTISGGTVLATDFNSDFTLVRLSNTPPLNYNVFYAGWSNIDEPASQATGIHHPRGDVKKISHDTDPVITSGYYTAGTDYWQVLDWNSGTTEVGSSGSPLFDQNHRIIGQLRGGDASCSNDAFDYYAKLAISWEKNPGASGQLKAWLDPNNSGISILNGLDPNGSTFANDAAAISVSGISNNICGNSITPEVTIRNRGNAILTTLDIVYSLDGNTPSTFNWSGNLSTQATATVILPTEAVNFGNHNYTFYTINPNGNSDQNVLNDTLSTNFFANDNPLLATLNLTTDNFGSESSWVVTDNSSGQIVLEGGGYPNLIGGQSFTEELCLYAGCFTFELRDSENDGYCCAFGTGNMLITEDSTGDTLAIENSNSFIGSSISFSFCMGGISNIDELTTPNFNLFPNPNSGHFNIEIPLSLQQNETKITIRNLLGELIVENIESTKPMIIIDLSNQYKGIYLVTIESGQYKSTEKIIIR